MTEKEYIEREALLRYLNDIWLSAMPNDFMPDDDRQLAMVRCMGLNDAIDAVKAIPAADVRPVEHDVWRKIKYRSICRDCSFRGFASWNYCPNCGRRMTTEGENE